jgi:hypothetical protein
MNELLTKSMTDIWVTSSSEDEARHTSSALLGFVVQSNTSTENNKSTVIHSKNVSYSIVYIFSISANNEIVCLEQSDTIAN